MFASYFARSYPSLVVLFHTHQRPTLCREAVTTIMQAQCNGHTASMHPGPIGWKIISTHDTPTTCTPQTPAVDLAAHNIPMKLWPSDERVTVSPSPRGTIQSFPSTSPQTYRISSSPRRRTACPADSPVSAIPGHSLWRGRRHRASWLLGGGWGYRIWRDRA
jgi:hypothetical protein